MQRMKTSVLGVAIASIALVTAACGADAEPESAPAGSNVATGSPIKIGAMAPSNGATAFPEVEYGVKAAEWYINNEMGGIDGHKLEVDLCQGDGSPETAVACANGFVSSSYPVVLDAYDFSFGGARPILIEAGIPFVGSVSGDSTNETVDYPHGFYWTGPLAITAAGVANMWDASGTTKANLAVADAPAAHTYVDSTFLPLSDARGVDSAVQWVDETKANWNAIAAAEMEGDPDMTGSISLSEDGCTALFTALRQQGWTGDIFVGSCTKYVDEMDPKDSAGTMTIPRTWLYQGKDNAPAEVADQLEDFATAMDAVGHGEALEARAIYAFAGLVTLAEVLQTVDGDITPKSVTTAITSVKDKQMFLGPKITCDGQQWPGRPTACSKQSIFFTVQEDGSYKPGDPDGFVDISAEVIDALS